MSIEAELAFGAVPALIRASTADGVSLDSSLVLTGEHGDLRVDNIVSPSNGHSMSLTLQRAADGRHVN